MCLFCCSSKPLSEDEKNGRHGAPMSQFDGGETFDIPLCKVWCCTKDCPCCLTAMVCFCPGQVYMRHKALNHVNPGSGWKDYKCCQGYFPGCCCCQPGKCGEQWCPCPCMCLESICCPGLAVSSTSLVIRERYNLGLDKDDVRLIRCTNCLQILACCCHLAACLTENEDVDFAARVTGCLADAVFCSVAGCMTAQVNHEIHMRQREAPQQQQPMIRD
mmetsp:Transcript_2672/g.3573  ORF Transcript_2672/g.3573 Transcript_2672/m.3573 type:complete len:217 (-) Transcript_2672:261-911(-)